MKRISEHPKRIPLAMIDIGERLRDPDPDHVAHIAESMAETGQRQPIEVRQLDNGEFRLIAGGHRLEAARSLGWADVEAYVWDVDDLGAVLLEIDENVKRADLNPLDRSVFLARRKEIYEAMHPETKNGANGGKGGKRNENDTVSFSLATQTALGLDKRTIERAVSIARNLTPESRAAIKGTDVAKNQAELLALAKLGPEAQARAVMLWRQNGLKTIREAIGRLNDRPIKTPDQYSKVVTAWEHASTDNKRSILAFLAGLPASQLAALGFRVVKIEETGEAA